MVTYEDECPECGEPALHKENDTYTVTCYLCGFSQKWKSYDEYIKWLTSREKLLERKAKTNYRQKNFELENEPLFEKRSRKR